MSEIQKYDFIPRVDAIDLAGGKLLILLGNLLQTEGSRDRAAARFMSEVKTWIHFQYYVLLLTDSVTQELSDAEGRVLNPEDAMLLPLEERMSPMAEAIINALRDFETKTKFYLMIALIANNKEVAREEIIALMNKYNDSL